MQHVVDRVSAPMRYQLYLSSGKQTAEWASFLRDNLKRSPNAALKFHERRTPEDTLSYRVFSKKKMHKLLAALLFAVVLRAQIPAPEVKDPLGRNTPQQSIFNFLEACHARNYSKATYYLDLSRLSVADRSKNGPDLAVQLEDLLDDTPFDIATLSRDPEGDLTDLTPNIDRLASFEVDGKMIVLQLERMEPRPGDHICVVSAPSVALIPQAHKAVAETPF